jgi:hypothetical protein
MEGGEQGRAFCDQLREKFRRGRCMQTQEPSPILHRVGGYTRQYTARLEQHLSLKVFKLSKNSENGQYSIFSISKENYFFILLKSLALREKNQIFKK